MISTVSSSDHGGAVVIVILLGSLISAIGAGLVVLSSTDRAIAGNFQTGVRMLHAAEAVVERVIFDFVADTNWTPALSGARRSSFSDASPRPAAPWGGVVDLDALTQALQAETDSGSVWGADTPQWRLFASGPLAALGGTRHEAPLYLAVWVADDPGDRDGNPTVDANGVISVRAQAFGIGAMRRGLHVVLHRVTGDSPDSGTEAAGEGEAPDSEPDDLAHIVPEDGAGDLAGPVEVRVLSWREVR
jgi:hypothetical protein